ncbi:hypothetical protein DL96DRAFT_1609462 [Flagelloscypha sp. PMI_526]|nr:hypothetical protein DL96DRAFT_1609462 [Flagelloscypha sp. PMI_526]
MSTVGIAHVLPPTSQVIVDIPQYESDVNKSVIKMVVNCYRPSTSLSNVTSQMQSAAHAHGQYTLILAQGSALHKETFELFLKDLFSRPDVAVLIREAWAFEWPVAGESSILNFTALQSEYKDIPCPMYATGIAHFIRTRLHHAKLVGIGNSAGAHTLVHTSARERIAYEALVVIETVMMSAEVFSANASEIQTAATRIHAGYKAQSEVSWPSRAEASEWIRKKHPYKTWVPEAVSLFETYGFKPVDLNKPDGAVTFSFSKKHEGTLVVYDDDFHEASAHFKVLMSQIPVHLVFGEKIDFVPRSSQDSVSDRDNGWTPASLTRVRKGTHSVHIQVPRAVSDVVAMALKDLTRANPESKL